jgi:hypothetical protein
LLPGGVFQRNTSGGDRWAAPGRAHHQHWTSFAGNNGEVGHG